MKKNKKYLLLVLVIIILILLWYFDIFKYFSLTYISEFKSFIDSFGLLAPIIFIIIYILAAILFLPGLPLTLLSGIVFGPLIGSIIVSISSTLGAGFSFLIGRYIGREWIIKKFSKKAIFIKLDKGIKEEGWKMVAITRLVPIFPFSAQNYIYGLTDVDFKSYILVSWLCMLPATIAYVFLAGSIIAGEGNFTTTISYIGVAIALLILLSLVSKNILKKHKEVSQDA